MAECQMTECQKAECQMAECQKAECQMAECQKAGCQLAECQFTVYPNMYLLLLGQSRRVCTVRVVGGTYVRFPRKNINLSI